jgi:hypothetical protein
MRRTVICLFSRYYLGDQINENEIGGGWGNNKLIKILVGSLRKKEYLGE